MKKKIPFIITLSLITSCGPMKDDYVDVTLLTPIGMGQSFHEMRNYFNPHFLSASTCTQPHIYVGYNEQEGSHQLTTKPLKILSNRAATSAYTMINWIRSQSSLQEAITISVLKNTPLDVGIIGAFYEPITGQTGDVCETQNGAAANYTAAVVGHQIINVNQTSTIPMNVWVQKSADPTDYTNPAPASTPSASQFSCLDYPANNNCAGREMVKITSKFSGTPSTAENYVKKVEYFSNAAGTQKVVHEFTVSAAGPSQVYVPHYFPMTITYRDQDLVSDVVTTVNGPTVINDANADGGTIDIVGF